MLQLNGEASTILTIVSSDCPEWLPEVPSDLGKYHYQSHIAKTPADARRLVRVQNPKALIAAPSEANVNLFRELRDTLPDADRPLLVLVVDQPPDGSVDLTAADLITLHQPFYCFEQQLRSFLNLRAQTIHLKHAQQTVTDENERLKQELKTQTLSTSEINFLKNVIVHNVAHELRTPLLQVKSAVSLLAEDADNMQLLISLAQGATTRLEAVVKNITLLHELVKESLDAPKFEPVVLREVVESAVRSLRRSWEHKDNVGRIIIDLPDNLPPAMGDKQRLAIAIQLLIDNALRFSKDQVEVKLRKQKNKIRIAVRDYGIGIHKDKIEKIFETFYQIDGTSTRPFNGLGIGLTIVRFILNQHNAPIEIETELDKGSTFSFALLVAQV
jgi:signal transduction histidine kinase